MEASVDREKAIHDYNLLKAKDFAKADAIRDQLKSLGWAVKDTAAGPEITKL